VPIYVRRLGPDAYGLLVVVSALTSYVGLMDLGLGQALVRYLSYYRPLNEGRPMFAILRVAFVWLTLAGAAISLLFFVGAHWLAHDVLRVSAGLLPDAVTVIRISCVTLVVGLLINVGAAVPVSFLRYDIAAAITGVFDTAGWVGPAIVVLLGHGIVGVAVFYLVSAVVALLAYLYFGRRLMRTVRRDSGPEWHEIRRRVLSFAGLVALNQVGVTVALQTNRLILGIVGGTAAAAYYQVPNMVTTKVGGLLNRIAQVLFPTGAALIARGDREGLRALYRRSSRLLFLVNGTIAFSLATYARPLLEYWVSPEYAQRGSMAMVLFVTAGLLNAASLPVGFLTWSAAKAGVNLAFALGNSAISLAAIYPLASAFGVTGAAGATLLGACVAPFFIQYFERRVLPVSSWSVFRYCHLPTLVGGGLVALSSSLLLVRFADGLVSTIALVAVTAVLSFAVSGLFGALSRDDVRGLMALTRSARCRLGL